jgi:hypothetical protein
LNKKFELDLTACKLLELEVRSLEDKLQKSLLSDSSSATVINDMKEQLARYRAEVLRAQVIALLTAMRYSCSLSFMSCLYIAQESETQRVLEIKSLRNTLSSLEKLISSASSRYEEVSTECSRRVP